MNRLAIILGSRIRAEIFRLLFAGELELHVREIQRRTGFNDRAIREELARLTMLDLITPRRDGNRLYYCARKEHPLYPDIRNMTLKTSGLVDILIPALASKKVVLAFVFGSIARNTDKAHSDIDLMIIGSIGLRESSRLLSGATEKLGREINPHVYPEEEFKRKLRVKDHFLTNVIKGPKMFVKGDESDLKKLAEYLI